MRHYRNRRQGVILLVVLGLLALFTLVAITFVIVASQARRGAVIASKAQQQGTPPDVLVRRAILEVARGSHNTYSVIGPHSLLEDMYGSDGFPFIIAKAGVITPPYSDPIFASFEGFQLMNCVGQGSMMFIDVPIVSLPNVHSWDIASGYYNGRIITMMNGPAGGKSSRILRYEANVSGGPMSQFAVPLANGRARLWMTPFLGMSANSAGTHWNVTGAPQPGNLFYINGAPFNGTGFGYNVAMTPSTGLLNYAVNVAGVASSANPCEVALLPNKSDPELYDGTGAYPFQCGWGGADEDYDLPDYQNMMLAGISWIGGGVVPPFPRMVAGSWNVTHPSLHRPELVYYWTRRLNINVPFIPVTAPLPPPTWYSQIPIALRRKIIMRPDPQDHYYDGANAGTPWSGSTPDFTGKVFDPINGPWDIDNDGDGIYDSIWVDLGMPPETAPDGTLYKPLFAFLVVDLDSRLNLNAHGNRAHYRWVDPNKVQQGEYFDPREEALIGPYALRTRINYPTAPGVPAYSYDQGYPVTASGPFAGGFSQVLSANGMGYSPAEVNLTTLLDLPGNRDYWHKNSYYNPTTAPGQTYNPFAAWVQVPDSFGETINIYRWLLEGRVGGSRSTLVGRYGEKHLLMVNFAGPGWPRYGDTNTQWGIGYPSNMNLGAKPGITTTGLMNTPNNNIYYTGDDNAPVAPMAAVHGTNLLQLKGNHFTENSTINIGGYLNQQLANLVQVGHYGTYLDTTGSSSIALDTRGQPLSIASPSVGNSLTVGAPAPGIGAMPLQFTYGNPTVDTTTGYPKTIDDPTEIDLSRGINYMTYWYGPTGDPNQAPVNTPYSATTDIDAPFNIAELEVMLRRHDVNNNSLPNRLATLARSVTWDNNYSSQANNPRRWATTDSWDIPCPSIMPTAEITFGLQALVAAGAPTRTYNLSLLDLFRGKLAAYDMKNGGSTSWASVNTRLNKMIQQQLISGDLLRGLRMDANRAFGNAWDDDGNFVIDDPNEFNQMYESMWKNSVLNQGNGIPFDGNNDGAILFDPGNPQADNFARQQFARQLYVLLMLFKDLGYTHPQTVSVTNNGQPIEVLPQGQSTPNMPTAQNALTAIRLAQFAINVVDFRDRDHIMTPFEFDMDPFNNSATPGPGWRVDNQIGYGSQDDTAGYRGLVWGCESQELLITEAVAFHDKRLKDTKYDTGPSGGAMGMPYKYPMRINNPTPSPAPMPGEIDPDLDQYRQPQGTAIIELYAAGNGNTWGAFSGDLYLPPVQGTARPQVVPASNKPFPLVRLDNPPRLHVGKMTQANNGTQYAVWRLAISRSPYNTTRGTTKENNDIRTRMSQYPDTMSLQTDLYMGSNLLKNQLPQGDPRLAGIGIERIVWLGDTPPAPNVIDYKKMYWNRNAGISALQPGQYAVIGPRGRTAIGRTYPQTATRVTVPTQPQYQQYFVLNGGLPAPPANNPFALYQDNTAGKNMYPYPIIGSDIQPTLNIIAAASAPANSPALQQFTHPGDPGPGLIGFNISEPLPTDPAAAQIYYSTAQFFADPDKSADLTPINDCLGNESQMNPYPDQPFDYQRISGKLQDPYFTTDLYDTLPDIHGNGYDGTRTDTIQAIKTVFLQRLANPLMPYNPGPPDPNYQISMPINPYVTVDWMPIDLTVFNSEDPKQTLANWSPAANDNNPYGQARLPAAPSRGERTTVPVLQFMTRQRGYPRNPVNNYLNSAAPPTLGPGLKPDLFNIWAPVSQMPTSSTAPPNNTLDTLSVYPRPATPPPASVGLNFTPNLDHTLGYLNLPFHFSVATPVPNTNPATASATGMMPQPSRWIDSQYLATLRNYPVSPTDNTSLYSIYAGSMGDPLRPFPWLVWNNRPFANHMELMLVPSSAPARILHEFTFRRNNNVNANPNGPAIESHYATQYNPPPFDATPPSVDTGGPAFVASLNYAPFSHLLNFFHSTPCNAYPGQAGVQSNPNAPDPFQPNPNTPPNGAGFVQNPVPTRPLINSSGNFYRLLEFMHVPSRFSGTEDLLNPAVYQAKTPNSPPVPNWADLQPFCAPFNRLSRFREPGRVNINGLRDANYGVTFTQPGSTIPQGVSFIGMTLSAMLNGYPQGDWFTSLWKSRQGYNVHPNYNSPNYISPAQPANAQYPGVYQNMYTANLNFPTPTVFANPFRSFSGAIFAPRDELRRENCSPNYPYRNNIEATLLRPTPMQVDTLTTNANPNSSPATVPVPFTPLFAPNMVQQTYANTAVPPAAPDFARNTDRNPYFRYIAYQRLGSVVTQRSNVYAGWITMGRFAVDRVAVDSAHPDGFRLVRELGSDTGDIHRRRAFFLMDRSIPVGFERGENMNVDKCILLHRVIE